MCKIGLANLAIAQNMQADPMPLPREHFSIHRVALLLEQHAPEYARARFAAIEQDHHTLTVLLHRAKRSIRLFASLQSLYVLDTPSIKTET